MRWALLLASKMYCKREIHSYGLVWLEIMTLASDYIPLVCRSGAEPWGKQQPAEAAGKSAVGKLAAGRRISGAAWAAGRSAG